tara:strand:+ start:61814 stop:62023 length:210 start_codon:yes stop_codon:yes gene_type:complete
VKPTVFFDEISFPLQTGELVSGVKMGVDPIKDLIAISDELANDIALERIRLADRMVAPGLCFMFQNTAV